MDSNNYTYFVDGNTYFECTVLPDESVACAFHLKTIDKSIAMINSLIYDLHNVQNELEKSRQNTQLK